MCLGMFYLSFLTNIYLYYSYLWQCDSTPQRRRRFVGSNTTPGMFYLSFFTNIYLYYSYFFRLAWLWKWVRTTCNVIRPRYVYFFLSFYILTYLFNIVQYKGMMARHDGGEGLRAGKWVWAMRQVVRACMFYILFTSTRLNGDSSPCFFFSF
jgi:hypothetical protein